MSEWEVEPDDGTAAKTTWPAPMTHEAVLTMIYGPKLAKIFCADETLAAEMYLRVRKMYTVSRNLVAACERISDAVHRCFPNDWQNLKQQLAQAISEAVKEFPSLKG